MQSEIIQQYIKSRERKRNVQNSQNSKNDKSSLSGLIIFQVYVKNLDFDFS